MLAAAGCTSSDRGSRPARHVWVDPNGDDRSEGSEGSPLATLATALDRRPDVVHLAPGTYADENLVLDQPLKLEGSTEGEVVVGGQVEVRGDDVHIDRVTLGAGLRAEAVRGLRVTRGRVAAGVAEHAMHLTKAETVLGDLQIVPGAQTGLYAEQSTLSVARVEITRREETKRGIRLQHAALLGSELSIRAGQTSHLQIADRSTAEVTGLFVGGGRGTGVVVLGSSTVSLTRAELEQSRPFGLLAQGSRIRIRASVLAGSTDGTLAVQGGSLRVESSTIGPSAGGAIVLSALKNRPAHVEIDKSTVLHESYDGARVAGGHLTLRDSRFVGRASERRSAGSSAIIHGPDARIELVRTRLESAAGHGLVITEDATAILSGKIVGAGQAALFVEGVRATPLQIDGLEILDCRTDSGAIFLDSEVVAYGLTVEGCPHAGVLAGEGASVTLRGARIRGVGRYSVAAFGDTRVMLEGVHTTGGTWATYASCADRARIVDQGENRLDGPVIDCP